MKLKKKANVEVRRFEENIRISNEKRKETKN